VSSLIIKAHGAVRDRQWILFGVGLFEGQGKGRLELTSEYLLPQTKAEEGYVLVANTVQRGRILSLGEL